MENRNALWWIIGAVAVVAIVVIGIVVANSGDDGDAAAPETTTTAAPETTTTAAPETTTTAAPETTTTTAAPETTTTAEVPALPDLGGREVSVGVENAYLPFNYIPLGETEGTGWDYDAWAAICDLLNCTPVFEETAWPAVLDLVAQGQIDTAADGISITPERAEVMAFSDPYMVVEQKFIKQLGDDRWATTDDVINGDAIVGTQVGTTNFELAVELLGGDDRIQAFDQFPLAIQALISGDVDVVIIDDAAGLGYIGENKELLETVEGALQSDPLGFAYPIGSDLIEPVNEALAVMAENGTMEELGIKYFGPDFVVTYDDIQ